MKKSDKEKFIVDVKGRLEKACATFLVDYQGLNVEDMNLLRNELRKHDIEFKVVKNRLLKLACEDTGTASMKEHFQGPCGLAISYDDAVAPAKILVEQGKTFKNLDIKVGQIAGKLIDFDGIKRLAELPSRDALLSQVLSAMQAVPTSFVRVLNGVILNLLYALKAIEKEKNEADAAGPTS